MHHIAAAMVFGVIFLSMPLAIIGNNFCNIWDHRRRVIFVERFNESYEKKFPDSTLPGRQDMVFMLRKYAKKKDNTLSCHELKQALVAWFGIKLSPAQSRDLWKNVLSKNSPHERITCEEFVNLLHSDYKDEAEDEVDSDEDEDEFDSDEDSNSADADLPGTGNQSDKPLAPSDDFEDDPNGPADDGSSADTPRCDPETVAALLRRLEEMTNTILSFDKAQRDIARSQFFFNIYYARLLPVHQHR
jgi:hypothetical protein